MIFRPLSELVDIAVAHVSTSEPTAISAITPPGHRIITDVIRRLHSFRMATEQMRLFSWRSGVMLNLRGKLPAMPEITRRTVLLACAAAAVLPQALGANVNADDLATMDATGLADLVRKGKLSALELVERARHCISRCNA